METHLNLDRIFASDAKALVDARQKAQTVHKSDVRAAGNEVEVSVRDYLRRMLPPRYYVTHGHIIDTTHRVSPQLDVIIADNFSLPSLLTTRDGTEYVPATSVLAIGEVKSTYYHSKRDYQGFHDKLVAISRMHRPLVENSVYQGITGSSNIRDTVLGSSNKYLNNLYSFLFCVDGGDFDFGKIRNLLASADVSQLPNSAIFLNMGIVAYANRGQLGSMHKYPNEVSSSDYGWCFMEAIGPEEGSVEGSNLSFLYAQLISHLSGSHLEPPNIYGYMANNLIFRKSSLMWADQYADGTVSNPMLPSRSSSSGSSHASPESASTQSPSSPC